MRDIFPATSTLMSMLPSVEQALLLMTTPQQTSPMHFLAATKVAVQLMAVYGMEARFSSTMACPI